MFTDKLLGKKKKKKILIALFKIFIYFGMEKNTFGILGPLST